MKKRIKETNISQIKLFKLWLEENKDKFLCKPVIFYRNTNDYLFLRYEYIINNIVIRVDDHSSIDVRVEDLIGLECVDILSDFLVALRADDSGNFYNESLLPEYRKYYDTYEQVFYDEFNNFLSWTNQMVSEDKLLYVYKRFNSFSLAKLITSEQLPDWKPEETNECLSQVLSIKKS